MRVGAGNYIRKAAAFSYRKRGGAIRLREEGADFSEGGGAGSKASD